MLRVNRDDKSSGPYGWDIELPADLSARWEKFIEALKYVDSIKIPRWLQYNPYTITSAQLHTFCDGSSVAYAACVYLRITDESGNVTPSQKLTIPRIELQGAVLAAKLSEWVAKSMHLPNVTLETYFWTDATIVLYWLRGDHGRLEVYVSNRVAKIRALSDPNQWNHVETAVNPADCASRGRTPRSLSKFDLWWHAPSWLRLRLRTGEDSTTPASDSSRSKLRSTIQCAQYMLQ